jgi:hypothetical protein
MDLTRAAAFIDRLPALKTSAEVGAAFAEAIGPSGYMAVSCGASCDTPAGRTCDFYFNTWPTPWLVEYQRNNYVRYDLAHTIARLTA